MLIINIAINCYYLKHLAGHNNIRIHNSYDCIYYCSRYICSMSCLVTVNVWSYLHNLVVSLFFLFFIVCSITLARRSVALFVVINILSLYSSFVAVMWTRINKCLCAHACVLIFTSFVTFIYDSPRADVQLCMYNVLGEYRRREAFWKENMKRGCRS